MGDKKGKRVEDTVKEDESEVVDAEERPKCIKLCGICFDN